VTERLLVYLAWACIGGAIVLVCVLLAVSHP